MGERIPEYEQWQADEEREREEHERELQEVSDDPNRMLLWALQKAKDYVASDEDEQEEVAEKPRQARIPRSKPMDADIDLMGSDSSSRRVGRDDPCPCGSGKKYKKCCMKKGSENPLH
jgi:preprotein translocase subunit SecA